MATYLPSSSLVAGDTAVPLAQGQHLSASVPVGRQWLRRHGNAWLPVALLGIVFAVESTAAFGSDRTSEPLRRLVLWLLGARAGHGAGSAVGLAALHGAGWSQTHHWIRKTGHIFGYGMFSGICFRAFWMEMRGARNRFARLLAGHSLAVAATFVAASLDEIHQSFLPNRTGTLSDVLLDTAGALALQVLLSLALQAYFAGRARLAPGRALEESHNADPASGTGKRDKGIAQAA